MANSIKITFCGGDRRQVSAARALVKRGYEVCLFALPVGASCDGVEYQDDPAAAIRGAEAVVLPLPASRDGVHLNTSSDGALSNFKLSSILNLADDSALIIGGKLPSAFSACAIDKGFDVRDYFESEAFQIKNAYTTAEAALSVAMNSLSKNIRGSRIAVTGYGRISKHLCGLLLNMGAEVTVCARKESDLAFASSIGCKTVNIAKSGAIDELLWGYDIIYNTVPSWIFGREFLERVDKKTLIIELASAPGGIDICAAKELSSNVSWALSLPGKYAPDSAGELIAECVDKFLSREVTKK